MAELENAENPIIFIFRQIAELKNSEVDKINAIESEIYEILKEDQEDPEALIALMLTQTMLGSRHKAKALAYKVWEIGGGFSEEIEFIFVDGLLNLGLVEMASVLLKPRFERISDNIEEFADVFLKFSIITGNTYLLERTSRQWFDMDEKVLIEDFLNVYDRLQYLEHFKAIQRIILDFVKENLCGYDFSFFNNRNFSELELNLYTDLNDIMCDKMYKDLDTKIDFYCLSNKLKRLVNLHIKIKNLKDRV